MTRGNSIPFPAGPALERGKVAQAPIDVGALLFFALFACVTAVAIGAAIFILFFVRC